MTEDNLARWLNRYQALVDLTPGAYYTEAVAEAVSDIFSTLTDAEGEELIEGAEAQEKLPKPRDLRLLLASIRARSATPAASSTHPLGWSNTIGDGEARAILRQAYFGGLAMKNIPEEKK